MAGEQVQDAASTRVGRNVDRSLCYGPSDFRVGGVVPVYGRDLFVHDCDQFTRDWFKVGGFPRMRIQQRQHDPGPDEDFNRLASSRGGLL